MQNCKSVSTPLSTSEKCLVSTPLCTKYRSIIGALQYLTLTCPDVAFLVNKACQFLHALATLYLSAVKRTKICLWNSVFGT
jgi:hypothetical protein